MKKSIVFFIAVGCFLLSHCTDVGSYSGNSYSSSSYSSSGYTAYSSSNRLPISRMLMSTEDRLATLEDYVERVQSVLENRITNIEKRLESLEESWNSQATYNLKVGEDRLKKSEKSLEELWAMEWERTKKKYGVE